MIKNRQKLVYSRNHKNNSNDIKKFKLFLIKYFGYKNFIIKFLLFNISYFYRLYNFLIRKIKE